MDLGAITNSTNAVANTYAAKETKQADEVKKYGVTGKTIGQPKLSENAKKYYEELGVPVPVGQPGTNSGQTHYKMISCNIWLPVVIHRSKTRNNALDVFWGIETIIVNLAFS